MSWQHIDKVGIEMEGGWNTRRREIKVDVSVHARGHSGEMASKPMNERQWKTWMKDNYPDNVDDSCGLHVHVSLKTSYKYMKLMDQKFTAYLMKAVQRWAKQNGQARNAALASRIAGRNHYCQATWKADEQAQAAAKLPVRYCHINYCHRFRGTIEFRFLPMFDTPEVTILAAGLIMESVEKYLKSQGAEQELTSVIEDDVEPELVEITA